MSTRSFSRFARRSTSATGHKPWPATRSAHPSRSAHPTRSAPVELRRSCFATLLLVRNLHFTRLHFTRHHPQRNLMPASQHLHFDIPPDHLRIQHLMQLIHRTHPLSIEGDNDIARTDRIVIRRLPRNHLIHTTSRLPLQPVGCHHPPRQIHHLTRNPKIRPFHPSFHDQLACHKCSQVGTDRETQALRRSDRRRIHPDNLSKRIDQRPPGIPG